jgi:hypothetical protein
LSDAIYHVTLEIFVIVSYCWLLLEALLLVSGIFNSNVDLCFLLTVPRLVRDNQTGRPKGFGFVKYSSEEEEQKAVKAMDGRVFSLLNCYLPYNLHALFANVNTFRILHTEMFNSHLSEVKLC